MTDPLTSKTSSVPSPSDNRESAIEFIIGVASDRRFSDEYLGNVVRSWLELLRRPGNETFVRQPDGYAYRYHDYRGDVIRFNGGQLVNGSEPFETVPYYFGTAPKVAAEPPAVGWQPIDTATRESRGLFWVTPLTIEDDHYVDTSGNPILAGDTKPYWVAGKFGCWSSLMKATHWIPEPKPPAQKANERREPLGSQYDGGKAMGPGDK